MSSIESIHPSPAHTTLLIYGAGGHGRVVADAALSLQSWPQIFASDKDPARCNGPYLAGVSLVDLATAAILQGEVHIAIGNNVARAREAGFWSEQRLATIIHPCATVSQFAHVGIGSFVAAKAVVSAGSRVGTACIINHGAVVDHDVLVGSYSHVAPLVSLSGNVVLGQRVMVGAGAAILPGIQVTDDVVIGAGAVVRTSIFEPGTYVGIPARRVK